MSQDRHLPDLGARLDAALRELYASPTDPAYWPGLEGRVLARIRQSRDDAWPEWYQLFGGWTGPRALAGVLAAGIAALAAASALVQSRAAEASVAYEEVVEATPAPAIAAVARSTGVAGDGREATLRYVISH
jgi:hypothetical protein